MRPWLLPLLALAACGSADDRPVTFSYIHAAIILPNCATSGCHSTLTQTAGVDLESPVSARTVFLNVDNAHVDIVPLLKGQTPEYRMPPDQPLPDADINLIDRWITQATTIDAGTD